MAVAGPAFLYKLETGEGLGEVQRHAQQQPSLEKIIYYIKDTAFRSQAISGDFFLLELLLSPVSLLYPGFFLEDKHVFSPRKCIFLYKIL